MTKAPEHIAIIMDGNGRWAQQHGLSRSKGHKKGVEAARNIADACLERGISFLTLFAFSSENWKRPKEEVGYLMELIAYILKHEVKKWHAKNVRIRIIGDVASLDKALQKAIRAAEETTENNTALTVVIALNYGGQWDICEAAKRLAQDVQTGAITLEEIIPARFSEALSTKGIPDPELVIRTSGEQRISNFLLWQLAYAEFIFAPQHWPDFDAHALDDAIQKYHARERRFGETSEQVQEKC